MLTGMLARFYQMPTGAALVHLARPRSSPMISGLQYIVQGMRFLNAVTHAEEGQTADETALYPLRGVVVAAGAAAHGAGRRGGPRPPAIASWRSTASPCATPSTSSSTPSRRAPGAERRARGSAPARCAWCAARARSRARAGRRPRPGEIATCANKCVFCFIHQLPQGMRRSLYVKDDDFRLSFLHGNLHHAQRSRRGRASRGSSSSACRRSTSPCTPPIPTSAIALLGQPRALGGDPAAAGAAGQGGHPHARADRPVPGLERRAGTSSARCIELAPLIPQVATTAIVPVGLTRHRERLPRAPHAAATTEARALVATVDEMAGAVPGRRSAAASCFSATRCICRPVGRRCPRRRLRGLPDRRGRDRPRPALRGRPSRRAARRGARWLSGRAVTVVTGAMYGPAAGCAPGFSWRPRRRRVAGGVPNDFFGRRDRRRGPADRAGHPARTWPGAETSARPSWCRRWRCATDEGVFLDDLTPADLARSLGGVPVMIVGADSARALAGRPCRVIR